MVGRNGCVGPDDILFFSIVIVFELGGGKETSTGGETHRFGGVG